MVNAGECFIIMSVGYWACGILMLWACGGQKAEKLGEGNEEKIQKEGKDNNAVIEVSENGKPGYKRKDLTIVLPEIEGEDNKWQVKVIFQSFKENCFPLSQRFAKTRPEKLIKMMKWFSVISVEVSLSLSIIEKFDLDEINKELLVLCTFASCILILILMGVFSICFIDNCKCFEGIWLGWAIKIFSQGTIWGVCCGYHLTIEIEILNYITVVAFGVLVEWVMFEAIRTIVKSVKTISNDHDKIFKRLEEDNPKFTSNK